LYTTVAAVLPEQVVFNIIVLFGVWPWVFVAYKRVINTLRIKCKGKELTTSTMFFWEGSFLMIFEFYLAFQVCSSLHWCSYIVVLLLLALL
jgi:hypothetical protein